MSVEFDRPQTNFSHCLEYSPQPELMRLIFSWVDSLPKGKNPIINLASGYGIEARELGLKGIVCDCQDSSWPMINASVIKVNYGLAEELDAYPLNYYRGALLKDAWVFLSPQQRQKMLQGLQKILLPGGSLLIVSEINNIY